MTTIKRFTPDYKMHAVRFEAFAREAEHGELVRFDAHQQVVSAVEAERDAQQKRADALAVENENQRDWINKCSELWDAGCDLDNLLGLIPETPATDAALAAIQARILPPNIAEIIDSGDLEAICFHSSFADRERIRMALYEFRQLREAK
jgi:hypothetical protein